MPSLKTAAVLLLISSLTIAPTVAAKRFQKKRIPNPAEIVKPARPAELTGTTARRIEQNIRADKLGLAKIATDQDLQKMVRDGVLVELTDTSSYFIDTEPEKICKAYGRGRYRVAHARRRVYAYPAVKKYLDLNLAPAHFATFGTKLKITSGARSLEKQSAMSTRGSPCYTAFAAPASSASESSLHIRGIVFDVSRRVKTARGKEISMPWPEIKWMRDRLIKDKKAGLIDAEEDSDLIGGQVEPPAEPDIDPIEENICYHIAVFPR